MEDVSILLNFTSKIAFEETDPLMSLINVRKPLLFYDRLSVGECETDEKACVEQAERKIASLHNLLDARALSSSADNGKIRLIVLLDLAGGLFQRGDTKLFPAQKVRMFRDKVAKAFGEKNPILKKIEYSFVFLNCPDNKMSAFYLPLAYDGISGGDGLSWLANSDISLNKERDVFFVNVQSPDEEWLLSDGQLCSQFKLFQDQFEKVRTIIVKWLSEIGKETVDRFNRLLDAISDAVKTVGQFRVFDYDDVIKACLRKVIGLGAFDLRDDCTFFILRFDDDSIKTKERDGFIVKSLVQLLCTLDDEDYQSKLKTENINAGARLFVMGTGNIRDVNNKAIEQLHALTMQCLSKLDKSKWTEDMDVVDEQGVKGYFVYTANAIEPSENDTHNKLNEKNKEKRDALQAEFQKIRRVPFFFGKKIGDWRWYRDVLKKVKEIYDFEEKNDRPLYDTPKRITNGEMSSIKKEADYRELIETKRQLEKDTVIIPPIENLGEYMQNRHKLMEEFEENISKLKKEMPKLGYFTCVFWMGVFSVLCFTFCYAFHFFWFDNSDPLYLIAIAFGSAGILFLLSSWIGQSCVKHKINAVYSEIDKIYGKLQENLKVFLLGVYDRAKKQRKADIDRRNLDEIEDKMFVFYSHNKRIDLWKDHFSNIAKKLQLAMNCITDPLDTAPNDNYDKEIQLKENSFILKGLPSMPFEIRKKFYTMETKIMNTPVIINNVTCFVKHFPFTEINDK